MTEPTKEQIVAETSKLMAELDVEYCRALLEHAHGYRDIMERLKEKHGRFFSAGDTARVRRQRQQEPLCGQQGFHLRLMSKREFEKLSGVPKCGKCENSLKKLRGEKISYERENWLRPSQEEVIRAIYIASGRQANEWCTTADLFPQTKYNSENGLRTALRTLEGHKVVEMQQEGKVCRVRLVCDCVVEMAEGDLLVAVEPILDAGKPKRAGEKG